MKKTLGLLDPSGPVVRSLRRIRAVARKEVRQLVRDRFTLGFIVGVPAVQLLLFGYAINQDVRQVPTAVVDPANSHVTRRLIGQLETFDRLAGKLAPGRGIGGMSGDAGGVVIRNAELFEQFAWQVEPADARILIDVAQNVGDLQGPAKMFRYEVSLCARFTENVHTKTPYGGCDAIAVAVELLPRRRNDRPVGIYLHAIDYRKKVRLPEPVAGNRSNQPLFDDPPRTVGLTAGCPIRCFRLAADRDGLLELAAIEAARSRAVAHRRHRAGIA